jgi:hypothetical protein
MGVMNLLGGGRRPGGHGRRRARRPLGLPAIPSLTRHFRGSPPSMDIPAVRDRKGASIRHRERALGASRGCDNTMDDIRLEKALEAIYEQACGSLPRECRKDCPLLRCIGDLLVSIKE